ncbi:MAG TPA: hypothetical protein VFS07_05345, partial [Gemmatimonadales bacterium]|nr:hypothetical protein [Gemmatimonadales bacterium]
QPRADSAQAARLERELARRADSLAAGVERLGEQLGAEGRQAPLQRTAEQAAEAARTMRDAADRAAAGERPEAAEAGTRAAEQLAAVPEDLNAQRDALQRQWRSEVTAELDEAMQEIARLGQSQLEVAQGFRRGESPAALRQQQGSVEEGTRRVLERVREAAGSNALVSPQLAANLAMAEGQMRRAREAVSSAQPNLREGGDRAEAAVDALNAVAQQLLQSSGDVNGAQSGSGLAEAMARMSELAQQQGAVGQGAQALLPLPGQGRGTAQLQALAAEQRAIAERLARVQAGGALPGAGQLADEARDLARRLEAGRLDRATAERQERLFRRMLDAGRTLQGEQEDPQKERQSVTATGDAVQLPPALRARLADAEGRLRMPGWDELQRFAPEERRLVVDYFRRLAERRP